MNPNISREIHKISNQSSTVPIWVNQPLGSSSVGFRHTQNPMTTSAIIQPDDSRKILNGSIENFGASKISGLRPSVQSNAEQREENGSLSRSKILSVKKFVPIFEGKPDNLSQSTAFKEVVLYKDLSYNVVEGKSQIKTETHADLYAPKYARSVVQLENKSALSSKQKLPEAKADGPSLKQTSNKTDFRRNGNTHSQKETNIYSSVNFKSSIKEGVKNARAKNGASDVEHEYFNTDGKTRPVQRYEYTGSSLNEYYSSQVYPKGLLSSMINGNGVGGQHGQMTDSMNFASRPMPALANFQKLNLKSKTALKAKAKESSQFTLSKANNETTAKQNDFTKKDSKSSNFRELLKAKKEKRTSVMESTDFVHQSPQTDGQIPSELLLSSHSIEHKSESQISKNEYCFESSFDVNKRSNLLGRDYIVSEFQSSRIHFNGFAHESDSYRPPIHREVQDFPIYKKNAPENILDQPSAIFKEQLLELSTLNTQVGRDIAYTTEERIAQFLLGVEVERLLHMMHAMYQNDDEAEESKEEEDRIRED
jgi:hypothetical protein